MVDLVEIRHFLSAAVALDYLQTVEGVLEVRLELLVGDLGVSATDRFAVEFVHLLRPERRP